MWTYVNVDVLRHMYTVTAFFFRAKAHDCLIFLSCTLALPRAALQQLGKTRGMTAINLSVIKSWSIPSFISGASHTQHTVLVDEQLRADTKTTGITGLAWALYKSNGCSWCFHKPDRAFFCFLFLFPESSMCVCVCALVLGSECH